MAAFSYLALDGAGKKVRGLIEGDSERQVRSQLKLKHLKPIEVSAARKKTENKLSWLTLSRTWKASELALVTRQLATLVQSNLPLAEAIEAVAQQAAKPSIKAVLMAIRSRVNEGHSLAKAMAEHPAVFNELYIGMVRAGEHAGFLGVVLERLADYTEKAHHAARQIRTASIYRGVLLVVSLLVIGLLMVFVVPDLVRIFDNTDGDLPWLTRALIASSDFIAEYGLWMLLTLAAAFFLFRLWLRAPANRKRWHRALLHLSLIHI